MGYMQQLCVKSFGLIISTDKKEHKQRIIITVRVKNKFKEKI